MAETTDENLMRVSRLLDVLLDLDQDDLAADTLGRVETRESGAIGTHEPCLGHNVNVHLWGYCPACDGTGLVKSRNGEYDPYLVRGAGTAVDNPPVPDQARGAAPVAEPMKLTPVEAVVMKRWRLRYPLLHLSRLLARAPEKVLAGVDDRDPSALSWLASRMPHIPSV